MPAKEYTEDLFIGRDPPRVSASVLNNLFDQYPQPIIKNASCLFRTATKRLPKCRRRRKYCSRKSASLHGIPANL